MSLNYGVGEDFYSIDGLESAEGVGGRDYSHSSEVVDDFKDQVPTYVNGLLSAGYDARQTLFKGL